MPIWACPDIAHIPLLTGTWGSIWVLHGPQIPMFARYHPASKAYRTHMGPIWVTIWDPYGAHMVFANGFHMGPIWALSGIYLGSIWGLYRFIITFM